jgi:hypothetical protein
VSDKVDEEDGYVGGDVRFNCLLYGVCLCVCGRA